VHAVEVGADAPNVEHRRTVVGSARH
jgi:hypothetical protein